ncbi:hypothetical protein [Candidatus Methanocrinis natronophilus]|uniref:Uncharacterized protein n=1 Tax=Candidatus Methanocrinis natronophilus TaxID=3033396 RepID=A0ABT5X9Z3_9EURY|nr:hypothetical protein [Candidatus Methanocrinis natronophilus]MDF0591525.1 hypothetical protein [Candidatus Methanocrinis natronophilus]
MKNRRSTLLYLAVAITVFTSGQVAADWLGGGFGIADVHHTAEYLAKAGSGGEKTTLNTTDGGLATLPATPADKEVYPIGKVATESGALEPSDFSGRWSLSLTEETGRSMELVIYQRGELVFGKGVLEASEGPEASGSSEDRGIESMVDWLNRPPGAKSSASEAAASGTVSGRSMKLDLVTLDSVALYRFDLDLTGNGISGGYTAYGSDGSTWQGTVTGSRIV